MNVASMRYTFISDACLKNTGFTQAEHLMLSIYDVLPKEYVEKSTQMIKNEIYQIMHAGKDNSGLTLELQRYNKDRSLH
jgi:hypothetical protein